MRKTAYWTNHKTIDQTPGRYNRKLALDSEEAQALLNDGETFNFSRDYDHLTRKWDKTPLTIQLTCRAERKGDHYYYYAFNRDQGTSKKTLRKAYLGKPENITIEKLEAICNKFAPH